MFFLSCAPATGPALESIASVYWRFRIPTSVVSEEAGVLSTSSFFPLLGVEELHSCFWLCFCDAWVLDLFSSGTMLVEPALLVLTPSSFPCFIVLVFELTLDQPMKHAPGCGEGRGRGNGGGGGEKARW